MSGGRDLEQQARKFLNLPELRAAWTSTQTTMFNILVEFGAALRAEMPAPREPLLAKVAESWIRTGQTGEGLRNDEYSVKHREIVMGIYGYCGKTIKDYLAYPARRAAGDPEQAK